MLFIPANNEPGICLQRGLVLSVKRFGIRFGMEKNMRKQIEGQINLFEYISAEDKKISDGNLIKERNVDISERSDCINPEVDHNNKDEISLFAQCVSCWCSTCRHNAEGRAVPRDFAGIKKPCPSCDFCISQNKAEICEIDSYDKGCKLRAEEEGIHPFNELI